MEVEHSDSVAVNVMEEDHDGGPDTCTEQSQESNVGQDDGQSQVAIRPGLKYPYGAMFFLMTSTVGLG